ncbi:RNI-like protein [Jaminaea rosea]|uniref:RNI-like protein n=1 Tax=Jaminaea rosea TaxID=1569628 RepID=A0A316UN78_9BASI|nr:RNI-like protein [Jaminaea rosea]PWN26729.1 RNI-like protein [Jaminaea rosea]
MSFSIAGRNLKLDSAADIQPHLDELNAIPDLTEVHFGGNTLGVPACEALAAVLATKKKLRIADFADIFTGRLISEIPQALKALCDSLAENEALVELDLSDNAFGGRSAEPMVHFLKTNRHYSVLKLNNNGLGVTGGSIVAKALIEAAEAIKSEGGTSQLRTVICGRNRLENGSAPLWAEAFAKHGGLREVRMFQNGIRMEGIEAISRGLSQCKGLEVLDLQDNTATLRGSRAIAAALPNWPELKVLNLSDMLLKPKGGMLVAEALAKGGNTKLETLQLQYDDIDRKGLAALGGAIKRHLSALTKLEINGNWADEDDECITSIKEALEAHGHEDALDELDELDPEGEESEAEEDDEDDEEDKEDEEEEKAEATKPEDTKAQATAPTAPSSTEAAPIVASTAGAAALATGAAAAAAAANTSSTEQKDSAPSKPVEAIKEEEKADPAPVHATTDTAPPSTSLPASASEMQVDSQTQSARAAAHAESSASGPSADQQLVELMGNVGFGQGEKKKEEEAAPVAAAAAGVAAAASAAAATTAAALSASAKEGEKKATPVSEAKPEHSAAPASSAEPAAPTAHAPLSGEAAPQAPAPGPAEVAAPAEAPTQAVGPSGEGGKKETLPVVETEEEKKPAKKDPITVAAPAATQEEIKAPAAQPQAPTEPQNQAAAAAPAIASAAPASAQVTPSKHAQQGSLDLNDELYAAPAAASSSAAPAPAPAQAQARTQAAQETTVQEQQQQKKKRGGLKAAFGAVKELLFK